MYIARFLITVVLFSFVIIKFNSPNVSIAQENKRWEYPELEHSLSARDGKTGERLAWAEMISQLKSADVVFLGETHDDDSTHRLQLAVYEALLEVREGKVVLAMEMFERDVQPHLDQYLQGKIDEPTFLAKSRPWGNYREAYRPLIEKAKSAGQPVIAANFPRPLLMKMSQAGEKGLDALGADRSFAPEKLFPNSALYWKRADNATRSHSMFMTVETDEQSRLTSTQSLWDNSMGEACVKGLDTHPGYQVLHLNGGFHTEYWDGTAAQVRQRKPDAVIKTIAIRPASNPSSAQTIGEPVADFVVFVEELAKNLNEGDWKVVVGRENSYRLYVPRWATAERPAPLLIWLSDDGSTAEDNLEYWKSVLGDKAAIAVIEPTHRQQERDMSLSGRWFWPDRFANDIGTGHQTIENVWQYVLNRFPVDPERVCLAGEGTGATLCAAVAMMTSKLELKSIAIQPRQFTKIKDFPLPLPENWGSNQPPQRDLTVVTSENDQKWWSSELQEYERVGIKTAWKQIEIDPWKTDSARKSMILAALGDKTEDSGDTVSDRKYLLAKVGSAKEKHWLRMLAAKLSKEKDQPSIAVLDLDTADQVDGHGAEPIEIQIDFEKVRGGALPLCPGSFGGTTVLVLSPRQVEAIDLWLTLETNDPLNARSRFHRTRIAVDATSSQLEANDRNLASVLQKLAKENRKNVLIVPAEFYAGDETMSALEKIARPIADEMTIQWLPGLGGELSKGR